MDHPDNIDNGSVPDLPSVSVAPDEPTTSDTPEPVTDPELEKFLSDMHVISETVSPDDKASIAVMVVSQIEDYIKQLVAYVANWTRVVTMQNEEMSTRINVLSERIDQFGQRATDLMVVPERLDKLRDALLVVGEQQQRTVDTVEDIGKMVGGLIAKYGNNPLKLMAALPKMLAGAGPRNQNTVEETNDDRA